MKEERGKSIFYPFPFRYIRRKGVLLSYPIFLGREVFHQIHKGRRKVVKKGLDLALRLDDLVLILKGQIGDLTGIHLDKPQFFLALLPVKYIRIYIFT